MSTIGPDPNRKTISIIGGGIAGLCAGCYAQMNGYQTRIHEMHTAPGGLLTSWERKGYTIDYCIHWLCGSKPGASLFRLWEEIGLIHFKDEIAANLSHGDRKRLEIGIALATHPKLLLLDEPTAGLSPSETRQTIELIKKIAEHLTLILVEHKMRVVMEVSNKITVLHYGKLLAQGTPNDIRNNEEVRRVYLGGVKI